MNDLLDTPERVALADTARRFAETEILPFQDQWEEARQVPRELSENAAASGLLGVAFPEDVGGGGGDFVDSLIVSEAMYKAGIAGGVNAALFTIGIALPHIVDAGNSDQIDRWVRPTLNGELIGSLAVTEPGGGSDVSGLKTSAVKEGEHYIVNGAKTFITSGVRADFVTTAVRTGGAGPSGVSLLIVPTDTPGFSVTRDLRKLGWNSSDTAELAFVDCRVPIANIVGEPGTGFKQIARNFETERLGMAAGAAMQAQRALDITIQWCRDRVTFGQPLIKNQLVQFRLAEMTRKLEVSLVYTHSIVRRRDAGETDLVADCCFAKNTAVEAAEWVVNTCLQLFGGTGYMHGAEIERIYRDIRIQGIGGGAVEVLALHAAKRRGLTS
ncbi:MAG: acyl-CoA dehydrogenase family protein [Antricoccus sp.]